MRGKLRDKRLVKRDVFKRENPDRKRVVKHDPRAPWLNQEIDEQDDDMLDEEEEGQEEETIITLLPQAQAQKK